MKNGKPTTPPNQRAVPLVGCRFSVLGFTFPLSRQLPLLLSTNVQDLHSVKPIGAYRTRILEKTNMKGNAELIRYAIHGTLVTPDGITDGAGHLRPVSGANRRSPACDVGATRRGCCPKLLPFSHHAEKGPLLLVRQRSALRPDFLHADGPIDDIALEVPPTTDVDLSIGGLLGVHDAVHRQSCHRFAEARG